MMSSTLSSSSTALYSLQSVCVLSGLFLMIKHCRAFSIVEFSCLDFLCSKHIWGQFCLSNLSDAMTPSHLSLDVPEEACGAARLHLQVRGQFSCTPRCERQTGHLRQQSLLDLPVCQGLRVCQHHSTLLHTPHIHIHTHNIQRGDR